MSTNTDTITIKLGELKRIESSINKLLSMKLPIKIAYNLGTRVLKKVSKELANIEEQRNKLIKEYGEEQEGGQIEIKDPAKQKQFFEDMSELFEHEVTFDFRPIDVNILDLKDSQGKDIISDITAQDMINLSEFFYMEEETVEKDDKIEHTEEEKVADISKKRVKK